MASIVGLIEILVGSAFDQYLTLFKFGPSWMGPFLVGRTDAELRERAGRAGAARGRSADDVIASMRSRAPAGTIPEAAEFLAGLRDAGVDRPARGRAPGAARQRAHGEVAGQRLL